ncbi:unnamed protein product [Cercospora beticola]|nr:unnamed protein product [Cercospora beticola]
MRSSVTLHGTPLCLVNGYPAVPRIDTQVHDDGQAASVPAMPRQIHLNDISVLLPLLDLALPYRLTEEGELQLAPPLVQPQIDLLEPIISGQRDRLPSLFVS